MNIRNIILKKYLIKRFSVVEAIEKFYPKKRVYLKKEVDKDIVGNMILYRSEVQKL